MITRKAKDLDLADKRVLILGCGFGEDAIRLTYLGCPVIAVDIAVGSVVITQQRAAACADDVVFAVAAPAEQLPFADESIDLVFINDVAHHFDIPTAIREIRRVLKPEGVMLANEPYTHTRLQALRESRFVRQWIYPHISRQFHGADTPTYLTADERKLDQRDLRQIREILQITETRYFSLLVGRAILCRYQLQQICDTLVLMIPHIGYWLAGRVVISCRRRQSG